MSQRITDKELLKHAHDLRGEAHRLLYDKGLLDVIRTVGRTRVIGSFAPDLMTWPDIDVSVELPHEKDVSAFFDMGREIVDRFKVAKMSFSNQFLRTDMPYDHGLYWGIRLLHEDRTWKIDLWGYGSATFQSHMSDFDQLKDKLQDTNRVSILRIKNEVCYRPEYRDKIVATDIYEAVSKKKIKTVKEFDEWRLGQDRL
jgi:hypothetical protein